MSSQTPLFFVFAGLGIGMLLILVWLRQIRGTLRSSQCRVPLPMGTGVKILPSTSAKITGRPQSGDFTPERLVIGGNPADWIINDIKVAGKTQFSQSGDLPGDLFAASSQDCFFRMDTVPRGCDFELFVTYIGDKAEGSELICAALGSQQPHSILPHRRQWRFSGPLVKTLASGGNGALS